MIWAVWAPLIAPFLAVPAARRLAALLPPRRAALLLAASTASLAVFSTASLALLSVAALLHLPFVAALGHISVALLPHDTAFAAPLGAAACGAALTVAVAAVRVLLRHGRQVLRADAAVAGHSSAGDLTVLPDAGADAYALPGRPGRIVVTAGMLRRLDAGERAVLLAHERAHLAARHHVLLLCAELAACLHPALRALREPLAFQLERWADEEAATAVGDRRLAARAVGRAALAASAAPPGRRPDLALRATAGPVPRRVAALLAAPATASGIPGRAAYCIAAALTGCLLVSGAATADATSDLHQNIESAQTAAVTGR
ncbi:Zn-dependent protease with chaperone function [Streptomyces olivoverticillatus]|uniref:Zn-dependent protease with chaperone function n=1 Tax=Streptomyces olivoverticillatus TaxID=66427 RepID=A0A7W7LND6_9ACTN|nr:Zn-dependent protease with chaperone function [Streptomyces olivoverticillatus]